MKIKWKILVICVAIPLIAGAVSGLISADAMETFGRLDQPPLSPPGWLFPVVWTLLYVLMGITSYLVPVSKSPSAEVTRALKVYALSLFFNFFWSIIFFNLGTYYFAFVWLLILWGLILWTVILYSRVSKIAAWLTVPYLLWVSFAGYLNLGVALLN